MMQMIEIPNDDADDIDKCKQRYCVFKKKLCYIIHVTAASAVRRASKTSVHDKHFSDRNDATLKFIILDNFVQVVQT